MNSRFFEAGAAYKLCAFEVAEGDTWAPPEGSTIVHVEPIIEDGAVDGLYLWVLVPDSRVAEVFHGERTG